MIVARIALAAFSLLACAWFALGVRATHDQNVATAILGTPTRLSASQITAASTAIDHARTLNPDEALNILEAQLKLHVADAPAAVAIARGVVAREPRNPDAWLNLEVISADTDRALSDQAKLRLSQLVPPVPSAR